MARLLRHLLTPTWSVWQRFPAATLQRIETAIADSETRHGGEIRFVVEAALDLIPLLQGQTGRERALEVFATLGVWDTEYNNGVLIYLLLADRDIEIVADRGIHARVAQTHWDKICAHIETQLSRGEFEQGALDAIAQVGELLAAHYPPLAPEHGAGRDNELPDQPIIL